MKFIDLIRTVSWIQVEADLARLYPEEGPNFEQYERVYSSLLAISPVETAMRIAIRIVQQKDDSYHDVYGLDNQREAQGESECRALESQSEAQGDSKSWALDFIDWNEWIAMEIDSDTLDKYEHSEIAAHCLWEMTFYGFYPEQIRRRKNTILRDMEKGLAEIRDSPLNVNGIKTDATLDDIIEAIRESRERDY